MRELADDLFQASLTNGALRGLIALSMLGLSFVLVAASDAGPAAVLVLFALGLLCAVTPHAGLPVVTVVYTLALWGLGAPLVLGPWTVLAAACLLVFHTACALVSSVPSGAPLERDLWRRYAIRLGLVLGGTVAVWLLVAARSLLILPGEVVVAALALLVVAGVLWLHLTRVARRPG